MIDKVTFTGRENLFNLTKKSYEYLNAGKVYSTDEIKAAQKFIKGRTTLIDSKAYTSPYTSMGNVSGSIKNTPSASENVEYAIAHGVPAQQATRIFIA